MNAADVIMIALMLPVVSWVGFLACVVVDHWRHHR